jgi:Protein of unknown function, DUF417
LRACARARCAPVAPLRPPGMCARSRRPGRNPIARHTRRLSFARRKVLTAGGRPCALGDNRALPRALRVERIGSGLLRYGLAAVIAGIGAEKFSDYEVKNITPLLENSPLFLVAGQANWTATHGAAGRRQRARHRHAVGSAASSVVAIRARQRLGHGHVRDNSQLPLLDPGRAHEDHPRSADTFRRGPIPREGCGPVGRFGTDTGRIPAPARAPLSEPDPRRALRLREICGLLPEAIETRSYVFPIQPS